MTFPVIVTDALLREVTFGFTVMVRDLDWDQVDCVQLIEAVFMDKVDGSLTVKAIVTSQVPVEGAGQIIGASNDIGSCAL